MLPSAGPTWVESNPLFPHSLYPSLHLPLLGKLRLFCAYAGKACTCHPQFRLLKCSSNNLKPSLLIDLTLLPFLPEINNRELRWCLRPVVIGWWKCIFVSCTLTHCTPPTQCYCEQSVMGNLKPYSSSTSLLRHFTALSHP